MFFQKSVHFAHHPEGGLRHVRMIQVVGLHSLVGEGPVSPERSTQPNVLRPTRASHSKHQLVHLRRCSSSSLIYPDCENTVVDPPSPRLVRNQLGKGEARNAMHLPVYLTHQWSSSLRSSPSADLTTRWVFLHRSRLGLQYEVEVIMRGAALLIMSLLACRAVVPLRGQLQDSDKKPGVTGDRQVALWLDIRRGLLGPRGSHYFEESLNEAYLAGGANGGSVLQ